MILDNILADKRIEVGARKAQVPMPDIQRSILDAPSPRDFAGALRGLTADTGIFFLSDSANGVKLTPLQGQVQLIAEVKKASPSKGLIRPDFDPVAIAKTYEAAGASAISVLTDEKYFQGSLEYLKAIRAEVKLPLLRKDFVVDPYQIYEARAAGADAVLLIVAALSIDELSYFRALASELGMASLVEVHTREELDVALDIKAKIIGINNRNLQTFETALYTTFDLAAEIPSDCIIVSESGISTRKDVVHLAAAGVSAILVGESLMREPDPAVKVKELLGI